MTGATFRWCLWKWTSETLTISTRLKTLTLMTAPLIEMVDPLSAFLLPPSFIHVFGSNL